MKSTTKKIARMVPILIALVIFASIGFLISHPKEMPKTVRKVSQTFIEKRPRQDPTLLATANALGIDVRNINLEFSDEVTTTPGDINDSSIAIGQFIAPNTIQIKPNLASDQLASTVAYEYMHYIWLKLPNDERTKQSYKYDSLIKENTELQSAIGDFLDQSEGLLYGQDTKHDEINSIVCVDLKQNTISQDLNAYCNHYIPNRAILFQM